MGNRVFLKHIHTREAVALDRMKYTTEREKVFKVQSTDSGCDIACRTMVEAGRLPSSSGSTALETQARGSCGLSLDWPGPEVNRRSSSSDSSTTKRSARSRSLDLGLDLDIDLRLHKKRNTDNCHDLVEGSTSGSQPRFWQEDRDLNEDSNTGDEEGSTDRETAQGNSSRCSASDHDSRDIAVHASPSASAAEVGGKTLWDDLESMARDHAVVIFSVSSCYMCFTAKQLFKTLGVSPAVFEIDQDPGGAQVLAALQEFSNAAGAGAGAGAPGGPVSTPRSNNINGLFPAIFVGRTYLGGLDAVISAHISGALRSKFKEMGVLAR